MYFKDIKYKMGNFNIGLKKKTNHKQRMDQPHGQVVATESSYPAPNSLLDKPG